MKIKVKIVNTVLAGKLFQQETHTCFTTRRNDQTDNKHLPTQRNSQPMTHPKRNFVDFKIRFTLSGKISKWNSVNNKENNYNKSFFSCIRLFEIHFSPLQLSHHQAEKPLF